MAFSVVSGEGWVASAAGVHTARNKTQFINFIDAVVPRLMPIDGVFRDDLTPQYRHSQGGKSPLGRAESKLKGYIDRIGNLFVR